MDNHTRQTLELLSKGPSSHISGPARSIIEEIANLPAQSIHEKLTELLSDESLLVHMSSFTISMLKLTRDNLSLELELL